MESGTKTSQATSDVRSDLLASVVVFLVALPLCMGIAIASGVPVAAGLITGIIGGLVVGSLAGCPLQVSGPAAGLTVIVYEIVQEFGLEMLGIVVLIGGILQLIAGIFRLGQWFRAVSPAALIAVVLSTIVAALLFVPVLYVEVPDNLWNEIRFPTLVILQDAPWSGLLPAGLLIAVVASAETLLCATAVDQMHQGPRTKYDRELSAQGVGNILCGLVGALPMTGVIVRSTANIQAGGKTKFSAILHGFWLLLFVAALSFLLRMIPTSALAAILVYTGYKLINPKSIRDLYKYGWAEVAVFFATVITIVVTDLLTGVIVGVALAAARLLYQFSHLNTDLQIAPDKKSAKLNLSGSATFLRLPKLASELENVPPSAELHVHFEKLDFIDHACLELLMNWARQHESIGGKLVIDWESLHARFRAEKVATQDVANGK